MPVNSQPLQAIHQRCYRSGDEAGSVKYLTILNNILAGHSPWQTTQLKQKQWRVRTNMKETEWAKGAKTSDYGGDIQQPVKKIWKLWTASCSMGD